jgi:hypothetical protein
MQASADSAEKAVSLSRQGACDFKMLQLTAEMFERNAGPRTVMHIYEGRVFFMRLTNVPGHPPFLPDPSRFYIYNQQVILFVK